LVLALGPEESREAGAGAGAVVAEASAGAVSAGLVSVSVQRVGARGALLQLASGPAEARVAEAADVLHGVPGRAVEPARLGGQVLLGPARAAVVAVVGAHGSLARDAVVAGEAGAGAGLAVAGALVGALHPGVHVVRVDDVSDPGKVAGAGAQGAVGARPFWLAVEAGEALAVVVHLAGAVVGAVVLAQAPLAVAALVPSHLSPSLGFESGGAGGEKSRSGRSNTISNKFRACRAKCTSSATSAF